MNIEQGKAKKEERFKKPDMQPITSPEGRSRYAEWFETIPSKPVAATYPDFDLKPRKVNDLSKLYHTKNTENGIFSLTLKYGVGTRDMPKLRLAVPLMNNAGVMAQLKPHEFKEALGAYNATASYSVDDDYLYIRLTGIDVHLREACILLTRQILMPALDEKQLNGLVGGAAQSRYLEKRNAEAISDALLEYALYRDKSDYIDRLSMSEINDISISNLTGEFQKATTYAAEIFYVGTLSFDEAYDILSVNLPLKAGEIPSASPKDKPRVSVAENTVYFLPNPDAEQTHIHFFVESEPYSALDNEVEVQAFNRYFTGGFGSVAMNEIREKRSLAYSTYGHIRRPLNPGNRAHFIGFVGTQADKTVEAVELYLKILSEFPEYLGRTEIVKRFLTESYNTSRPSFRTEASTIAEYLRQGYNAYPALSNLPKIAALSFDKLREIHRKYIAGKPVTVAITGNPKDIDLNALARFGKVERLSMDKVIR